MKTDYAYTPTVPAEISTALDKVFAAMTRDERSMYRRSANSNFITVAGSGAALDGLDALIDMLCLAHPSRFFVAYLDEKNTAVRAEIAARCTLLSKSETLCSEVVRIGTSAKNFSAVPGIVRAHLLTGMPCELFLYDPKVPAELLNAMLPLADQIIFDSGDFERRFEMLRSLDALSQNLVDLQWIRLAPWRDELKNVFARPGLAAGIAGLDNISIEADVARGALRGVAPLLLAGWLLDRLGLTPRRAGSSGIHCSAEDGRQVLLTLRATPAAETSRLAAVTLRFAAPGGGQVRLSRNTHLEIAVEAGKDSFSISRPLDDDTQLARLERHFLIGESLSNYRAALRSALALAELGARGTQEEAA